MKHLYPLILLLFLLPVFALAQSNYKPGYAVTLKGDTVRGFISYKRLRNDHQRFIFKTTTGNPPITYTVNDVQAFAVNDEVYYRYIGKLSKDRTALNQITLGLDSNLKSDTVFLRLVRKGTVSLYYYGGNQRESYYIKTGEGLPEELEYHQYYDEQLQSHADVDEKFKIQLQRLAYTYQKGNTSLINEIQDCNYNKISLARIIDKINGSN